MARTCNCLLLKAPLLIDTKGRSSTSILIPQSLILGPQSLILNSQYSVLNPHQSSEKTALQLSCEPDILFSEADFLTACNVWLWNSSQNQAAKARTTSFQAKGGCTLLCYISLVSWGIHSVLYILGVWNRWEVKKYNWTDTWNILSLTFQLQLSSFPLWHQLVTIQPYNWY